MESASSPNSNSHPMGTLPEGVASAIRFCHTPTAAHPLADERGRSSLPAKANLTRSDLPNVPSNPTFKTLEHRVAAPLTVGQGVLTEPLFPSAPLCASLFVRLSIDYARHAAREHLLCSKRHSHPQISQILTDFKTPIPFPCFARSVVKDSSLPSTLAKLT